MLSRLYGSPIDVMRVNGRIFVMSGDVEVEKHDHEHEQTSTDGHRHSHAHDHGTDHGRTHSTTLTRRTHARCLNTISW